MGVPISFLDKYNPDQFEIIGYEKSYHLRTKIYPKQIQIDKNGKRSNVTKLNDGVAIKVQTQPDGMTYYVVDNEYYVQSFKRVFIRHKSLFDNQINGVQRAFFGTSTEFQEINSGHAA